MTLYCESIGTGPDLVLLHGWGWHGGAWRDVASGLADEYRVWIPDLPGHGRSRESTMNFTLMELAQAVNAQVPASATWVGWSLGGLVALVAAATGLAQRLVLVATTPRFIQDANWDCAWTEEWFDRFSADVASDAEGALARFVTLHLAGDGNERSLLRQLRTTLWHRGVPDPTSLRDGLRVLREADLRASLAQLATPALVVHGERDQIVPWRAGEYLAQSLRRARFLRVDAAGHALPLSHGAYLVDVIREFCRE